jgi:hypothetical protein
MDRTGLERVFKAGDGLHYVECMGDEACAAYLDPAANDLRFDALLPGYLPVRRVDIGERVIVGREEAGRRLAPGPRIKVVVQPVGGVALAATWRRRHVLDQIRAQGVEEAGPFSTAAGFGLASWDGERWLFFETRA